MNIEHQEHDHKGDDTQVQRPMSALLSGGWIYRCSGLCQRYSAAHGAARAADSPSARPQDQRHLLGAARRVQGAQSGDEEEETRRAAAEEKRPVSRHLLGAKDGG